MNAKTQAATGEVVTIEPRQVAVTPMHMLEIAVQQGADLEKMKQLMDLQERWEATQARKAFVVAMTQFKADPPAIFKSKHVNIPGGAKFAHASLAQVVDAVCASLSKYGLSHRWDTKQENGTVSVTCVITHNMGHAERTTLAAAPDDSGKKNSIQQIASTVTYLERYTLMAATGLAARDMDNDGAGADVDPITAKQAADIEALATEVGADLPKFLKYICADSVAEIPAAHYKKAVAALEAKRGR